MKDPLIKLEISKILNSEISTEEKAKAFEILIEEVKIAYYFEAQNDISRENAQSRRELEKLISEQTKTGKVVKLDFSV
jgi:hypothetical protein